MKKNVWMLLLNILLVSTFTGCGDDDETDCNCDNTSNSLINTVDNPVVVDEKDVIANWVPISGQSYTVTNGNIRLASSVRDYGMYDVICNLKNDFTADWSIWRYSEGRIYIYDFWDIPEIWTIIAFSNTEMTLRRRFGDEKFGTYTDIVMKKVDDLNYVEDDKVEQAGVNAVAVTELQVEAGKEYQAYQEGTAAFTFNVTSTTGHYADKSQVVIFKIENADGKKDVEVTLSDADKSYLMRNADGTYEAVGKVVADANADKIVMVLACANSTADYTITSGTINDSFKKNGAKETKFAVKK